MVKNQLIIGFLGSLFATSIFAKPVPDLFIAISRYCDVPARILYAVAKAESGRTIDGELSPWPWTLNIEGSSFYFESREDQFDALMIAISEGQIVDVGYMQLNWRWKFDLLISPWQATDPYFNITTGCRVIRNHYEANSAAGWFEAVGRYHVESNSDKAVARREAYTERVRRIWRAL